MVAEREPERVGTVRFRGQMVDPVSQEKIGEYGNAVIPCDEGNDDVPPPLAYLAASVSYCVLTQLVRAAEEMDVQLDAGGCDVELDVHFDGESAVADGVNVEVALESSAPMDTLVELTRTALGWSYALQLVRGGVDGSSQASLNGMSVDVPEGV